MCARREQACSGPEFPAKNPARSSNSSQRHTAGRPRSARYDVVAPTCAAQRGSRAEQRIQGSAQSFPSSFQLSSARLETRSGHSEEAIVLAVIQAQRCGHRRKHHQRANTKLTSLLSGSRLCSAVPAQWCLGILICSNASVGASCTFGTEGLMPPFPAGLARSSAGAAAWAEEAPPEPFIVSPDGTAHRGVAGDYAGYDAPVENGFPSDHPRAAATHATAPQGASPESAAPVLAMRQLSIQISTTAGSVSLLGVRLRSAEVFRADLLGDVRCPRRRAAPRRRSWHSRHLGHG